MKRVILSLMFRHDAEEAVTSYVSLFSPIFGDTHILSVTYYGEDELEALRTVPEMTEEYHARAPGVSGPSVSCSADRRSWQ